MINRTALLAVLPWVAAIAAAGACAPVAAELPAPPAAFQVITDAKTTAPTSLTLLGTAGGPVVSTERAGIASLLRVNGENYLIDAGHGVAEQLAHFGMDGRNTPRVFITHLHDDHYIGLAALASFAFTLRGTGMEIIGPPRTGELETALESMLGVSAKIRIVENRIPTKLEDFVASREFTGGEIYRDANVVVTALENQHFRLAADSDMAKENKSYTLAFAFDGMRVVFTGDTGPFHGLTEFTRGADVLVAEMASYTDVQMVPEIIRPHMEHEHLSPTAVGQLAHRAGVKVLVLSHIGIVTEEDMAAVRKEFSGQIVLGSDLMTIPLK